MAHKQLKLWFDKELAKTLSKKIKLVHPVFDSRSFIKSVSPQLDALELKDRIEVFADCLYEHFDSDYKGCIEVLLNVLGPENEEETGMFKEYYWVMPIAKLVEKYGLSHFKLSMTALEEITKRNTSEYAIRPYLEQYQQKTLKQVAKWSKNKNSHVRRLASEGIRPRLPWAKKLDTFIEDLSPILPILSNLKGDKSKYVQKSVANCLNDIYKDNMSAGQELIEQWISQGSISKETSWIIKHSLRNLIKKEDKWAMKIMNSSENLTL